MERKTALITGASEGIGREFALQLSKEGYELTLVARNEARLKALLEEIKSDGKNHQSFVADLSIPSDTEKASQKLLSGRYQLLVNNAGRGLYGLFQKSPLSSFEEMMRLNCDTLVKLSHSFLAASQKGDCLINVASVLSFCPLPGSSIYAATKAFVASFSQSLWYEQKKREVYVMCLCPGATESEFHTRAGGDLRKKPPKAVTQSSKEVVEVAIRALKKRCRPVVIPGVHNKLAVLFSKWTPTRIFINTLGKSM